MLSFKKNKKQTLELSEIENSAKLFQRKIFNKTVEKQQGLKFSENIDTASYNSNKGIKQGLSYNVEKITQEQMDILKKCAYENTATDLMKILKRTNKTKFRQIILTPLIEYGFFELTLPEKPTSPKQKYRATGKFIKRIERI
ncbi:ATP-dependent DNA helicase [uncultured Candidatus Thioglobus sp.]|nr:ATP-dependent DNA helicase [uncultured Candidatus Thioglobus sp.]SMN01203.1 ATP-dependent DNA helicase [uncultured Candidatus Thioglobus sp.]